MERKDNQQGDSPLASSPLKQPRDQNAEGGTSPVKKMVDRSKIIGRPIEIVKGKYSPIPVESSDAESLAFG